MIIRRADTGTALALLAELSEVGVVSLEHVFGHQSAGSLGLVCCDRLGDHLVEGARAGQLVGGVELERLEHDESTSVVTWST